MALLIAGIIVFFGVHFVPSLAVKGAMQEKFGEGAYKGLFSLGAFAGLVLIVLGFRSAEFVPLWDPLPFGRSLAISLMPVAAILVISANMPNNIKRWLRHPMLIGITLWAFVHLMANGDLSSTIIFASFLAYSLINIALVESGGRYQAKEPVSFFWDIGTVVAGIVLYAFLFGFHHHFAGIKLY